MNTKTKYILSMVTKGIPMNKLEVRQSVEQSIKDLHINRSNFYEASKFEYKNILKKVIYKFGNDMIKKYCTLSKIYDNVNDKIPRWSMYLCDFPKLLDILNNTLKNPKEKFYLIFNDPFDDIYLHKGLNQSMLYEGYINEIFEILMNSSLFYDFYIVSKKFEFMVSYNDDGEALIFIGKDFKNIKEYIKMRNIKLYCYSDKKERIRLDFTAYIDKDKNTMWEDWHIGNECLVVYQTDYNRLLIPYFEKIYPFKEPITHTLETHFDACFDNWFNKENCYKIIELIQKDIENKTKKELQFYNSFIEWISKQLQFADGIVVDGNL